MKHFALFIVAAFCTVGNAIALPPEDKALWLEDIEAYATSLEDGHIDLFHSISRSKFNARLDELRTRLPAMSEYEIVASLMKITHAINDGHTAMPLWGAEYHRYPLIIRWVDGEAIITGASSEHIGMLGARIIGWDGASMKKVYERLAPYVPFVENAYSEAVRVAGYLPVAELGHAIGLTKNAMSVTVKIEKDGIQKTHVLNAIGSTEFYSEVSETISYRRDLLANPTLIKTDGIRFALLEDGEIGYIQFDEYPPLDEMRAFSDKVYTALETAGTRNVVIDFRESYGGNFFVGLLLAADLVSLDQIDWQNGVTVLTSGVTFSAAMSNSAQFADILNARLIGEPTGASPCGYQDMGQFNLPNSGYLITYSKRRFCFAEPVGDALQPDVTIAIQPGDFINNRERAIEWVINDVAQRKQN